MTSPAETPTILAERLSPGAPLTRWLVGQTHETRYDTPDQPMAGAMDPFFFLTKDKNFIPHEYPCRTAFAAERRGQRPRVAGRFAHDRVWLPFGSPRLDLSGFWFRPTVIATWARTAIVAHEAGAARLKLSTCGGAVLYVDGVETGHMARYQRNFETAQEFEVELSAGVHIFEVFIDDLAERDARYFIRLDWMAGPGADNALPMAADGAVASAVEAALDAMHFERPSYVAGEVALVLPAPLPVDAVADIAVEGDFMSREQPLLLRSRLAAGATRLPVADTEDLPGDFRHFTVTLTAGGFSASRVFGVEICQAEAQGAAPATLDERIAEALAWVADRGEPDTVGALARLAAGRSDGKAAAMIAATLPVISDCHDCADFALVPLIWTRARFADRLDADLVRRIDDTMPAYRYCMDEPGNDVQWYFSENHALLFHTAAYLAGALLPHATFLRSGRKGAEQSSVGRERVRAWLDHFEQWEMAEFNSAPYFPIDLKGLTALYALAHDADIAERAGKGIARLVEIVANSAHHGAITGAQGRSYEHTLRAGRSLELSGMARLLWGAGHFGARFHALPQLALCLRDHGLELAADLQDRAVWTRDAAQGWCFKQGENGFAALQHHKSADTALGTAAAYRWYEWGYQETLIHARIGKNPDAQLWINHPGEVIHSGYGRPSYWGGSASIPRVQQFRNLAIVVFDGADEQPDFTHAWFPRPCFDRSAVSGDTALAQSGNGLMVVKASGTLQELATGPTTGCELRLAGRKGWWLVWLGQEARDGTLDEFAEKHGGVAPHFMANGDIVVDDPHYGRVVFRADGKVAAAGETIDPATWTVKGERTVA